MHGTIISRHPRRRLSVRHRIFAAGYRRGLRQGFVDVQVLHQEELQRLTETYDRELQRVVASCDQEMQKLRDDYSALAVRWHTTLRDIAILRALEERREAPFKPLH